jgi:hypothetical protein
MSSDSLQAILSHAETLNMPEGDYLYVASALKSAFEKRGRPTKWTTYKTDTNEEITITMTNGSTNISSKSYVKSVSSCNIKEPGPIKFKINMVSEIIYKDTPEMNKTFEHILYPLCEREGRLYTLFELIEPLNVTISYSGVEFMYDCYTLLKNYKDREDKEWKINFPDDEDGNESQLDNDRFMRVMRGKFIEVCRMWFWEKYNKDEYE